MSICRDNGKYVCSECGEEKDIFDLAYLGPDDRGDMSCNPFQQFIAVCYHCEDEVDE